MTKQPLRPKSRHLPAVLPDPARIIRRDTRGALPEQTLPLRDCR
ncbi:MAG TPA: hypothetical protein O0Y06_08970 [Methanocorpusculum sp.]|nr:hypothetical protein [Methanocorpusculum sp.]HJK81017.1 hypothetical protein [Methanocorpusculum sp.]